MLVGKNEIVDAAHEPGIKGLLRSAVHLQPFTPIVIINGIKAARVERQSKTDGATQDGENQIDDLPDPA